MKLKLISNEKINSLFAFVASCFLCSCVSHQSDYQKELLHSEYNEQKNASQSGKDKLCLYSDKNDDDIGAIASYFLLFGAALTGAKNSTVGPDFKAEPVWQEKEKCIKYFDN